MLYFENWKIALICAVCALGVLLSLPNLPDPSASDEDEVLREVGEAGKTGRNHVELLGEHLDMERAARVSGSRFGYLVGDTALLAMALYRFALDHVSAAGFTP